MLHVRDAVAEVVEDLARIWREGWPDARDRHLPPELLRCGTLESFRTRLNDGRERTGIAVGFAMMKTDELDELCVTRKARGTGVARAFVVEALHRIGQTSTTGRGSPARSAVIVALRMGTPDGPMPIDAWRYEIAV